MASLSRSLLIALAVLAVAACGKSGGSFASEAGDMALGNPNAKVTVVEYASVACPFCARFNTEQFPAFKAKYIDTGRIHYIFREMLVGETNEQALGEAGFLMARCLPPSKYFDVLDETFRAQPDIYKSGDLRGGLLRIAQANGMTEQQFDDCVGNADAQKAIKARTDQAGKDGVNSTPTFFVNGKKAFEGAPTPNKLDEAIAAASQ